MKFGPVAQEMSFKEKVYGRWKTDEDRSQYLTLSLPLRWAKNYAKEIFVSLWPHTLITFDGWSLDITVVGILTNIHEQDISFSVEKSMKKFYNLEAWYLSHLSQWLEA